MDDVSNVPGPTDTAVAGATATDTTTAAPGATATDTTTAAQSAKDAFEALSVDAQVSQLDERLRVIEAAALPVATAPAPAVDPNASEIGNLHAAVTRLFKHIFGESF